VEAAAADEDDDDDDNDDDSNLSCIFICQTLKPWPE